MWIGFVHQRIRYKSFGVRDVFRTKCVALCMHVCTALGMSVLYYATYIYIYIYIYMMVHP